MSDPDSLHDCANEIFKTVISPDSSRKKGIVSRKMSLKPTSLTEPLLLYLDEVLQGDTVSQYFCRMFMSYSRNPLNIRERIVFKETYDLLQNACKNHQSVSFVTSRYINSVHEVLPYSVSVGKDELFNYLLCQERDKDTGINKAATYRLCRIKKARQPGTISELSAEARRHLDMMQLYGPQYAINDDEEACVRLSDTGIQLYNRIYFGRPIVDRAEGTNYFFKCSKNQLFLYFRRFGAQHAIVLYPESLRQQIIEYHRESLKAYTDQ